MQKIIIFVSFILMFVFAQPAQAYFLATKTVVSNQAGTICWLAPGFGAWGGSVGEYSNATDINFTWPAAETSCPTATVTYNFQIFSDVTLATLVKESTWISAANYLYVNIPEGEYWWRIQTTDQYGNVGSSSIFHLIVDRTVPDVPVLSVAGSWDKQVTEKITTGWTTAGDVTISGGVATIGSDSSDPDYEGKYVWENRLMQSFDAGAKTLGLSYDFHTNDWGPNDDPGFFLRLNGQQIFSLAASGVPVSGSTGWQRFLYDLSDYSPTDGKLNLAIYAGNTGDKTYQSWACVKDVTTYAVTASDHATYSFNSSNPDVNHYEYNTGSGWSTWNMGDKLQFSDGSRDLTFRSVDNAGNVSSSAPVVAVLTDTATPSAVLDFEVYSTASNAAYLDWTSPLGATKYDIRFATFPIVDDAGFATASAVSGIPAPKNSGGDYLEVLGLNPETTYFFGLKSADASPNWSPLAYTSGVTLPGTTINNGDLIINEVMWGGAGADWFIELRNMTDRTILLDDVTISGLACTFPGSSIGANGFFVISQDNCPVLNFTDGAISLELQNSGTIIDKAGDSINVFAGDGTHSMERTEVPSDGTSPFSWYTCLEGNTKGVRNRSVNEPLPIPPTILELSLSDDKKTLAFEVKNLVSSPTSASFELTYDTDTAPQGVVGSDWKKTITLGTCSTGGTCVYHTGVKNFILKVNLVTSDGHQINLEKKLL